MSLDVTLKAEDLEKASLFLKAFGKKAESGVYQALNRAIKGVRTDAARLVSSEYGFTKTAVKKTFMIGRMGNLEVFARSTGYKVPLYNFSALPRKPRYPGPPQGVSVKVKSTRKFIERDSGGRLPFITKMSSGHIGVFRRTDNESLPIKELSGPSIPSVLGTDNNEVKDKLQEGAVERFNKNLTHAIDRAIQGARV